MSAILAVFFTCQINTNRNGEIEWDELVSHLLLGYFGNDPENQRASLQAPIMGRPTIMRSQHRHPISKICFCPDVAKVLIPIVVGTVIRIMDIHC